MSFQVELFRRVKNDRKMKCEFWSIFLTFDSPQKLRLYAKCASRSKNYKFKLITMVGRVKVYLSGFFCWFLYFLLLFSYAYCTPKSVKLFCLSISIYFLIFLPISLWVKFYGFHVTSERFLDTNLKCTCSGFYFRVFSGPFLTD